MSECTDCLGCGLTELASGAVSVKVDPTGAIGLDPVDPLVDPISSGLFTNVDGITVTATIPGLGTPGISAAFAPYVTQLELAANVVPANVPPFYRSLPNSQPDSSLAVNVDNLGAYAAGAGSPAVPAGLGGLYVVGVSFLIDYFGSPTVFDPDGFVTFEQATVFAPGLLNPVGGGENYQVPVTTYYQRRIYASTTIRLAVGQWVRVGLAISQNHVVDEMTLSTARVGD